MENMTQTPFCSPPTKTQRIRLERADAQNYMNTSIHLNADSTDSSSTFLSVLTSSGGSWSFLQDASDPFKLKENHFYYDTLDTSETHFNLSHESWQATNYKICS